MIELNLLPDIKLEYIKAERSRRLILSIAVLVSAAAIASLVLILILSGLQKKHLSDLNRDINSESQQLKNEPSINQILTVQNQLESLTALHNSKPAVSRLFGYLDQVTPAKVSIDNFSIDFTKMTISISGSSDTISSINQYVDTLKFTTYTTGSNTSPTKAFSNVVLTSFSVGTSSAPSGSQASYSINMSYDTNIFDNTQKVTLTVPNTVTTRSAQAQPGDLFIAPASTTAGSH